MKSFTWSTPLPRALVATACVVLGAAMAPRAHAAPTVVGTSTSPDGLLTLVLTSSNPSDTAGVDNTYTWTATNNSPTITLSGVVLGSHWGDWCGGGNCFPTGPTIVSIAPGCSGQSAADFPEEIADAGVWCSAATGTTLAPGASISGSVTVRPLSAGPADYGVYSGYDDPVTGVLHIAIPRITQTGVVAPVPTDIQLKGAASNGSPAAGSTFTYTYEVKNAGPWGTYGGIVFVDTLPDSLTYVSSVATFSFVPLATGQPTSVSVPFCSAVGQTVMCPLEDLRSVGPFNQATVAITVAASGVPQQIVNTATVHTVLPQADSNAANNSSTVTVTTK